MSYFVFGVNIVLRVAENLILMRSALKAINNAPVIYNHCFTPAPEQDGDIHGLVNVLCFYFYIASTMWRKCRGLIDLDKHEKAL